MSMALRVALVAAATSSFASAYVPMGGMTAPRSPLTDFHSRCGRGRNTMTLAVPNSNSGLGSGNQPQPQASNAQGEDLLAAVAARAAKAQASARCAACRLLCSSVDPLAEKQVQGS
jgi:hypothetical protein